MRRVLLLVALLVLPVVPLAGPSGHPPSALRGPEPGAETPLGPLAPHPEAVPLLPLPPPLSGGWTTYLQNTERTSANLQERTLATSNVSGLYRVWQVNSNGSDYGSATIVNGTAYVGSWNGTESAINLNTGQILWSRFLGVASNCSWGNPVGVSSNAAVWNGTVYVGGGDDYWYALYATNGSTEWRIKVGDNSPSGGNYNWASPLLYHGYEYIGLASCIDSPLVWGRLLQVNLTGNHTVFHQFHVVPKGQVGGSIWSSPSLDAATNTVWIATGNEGQSGQPYTNAIVALNATNLTRRGSWQVPNVQGFDDDFGSSPTLLNDSNGRLLVVATNKNGVTYALNRSNVTGPGTWRPAWSVNTGGGFSSAAFDGSRLYVGGGSVTIGGSSYSGSVWSIDPTTGKVKWTHGMGNYVTAAVAYANGLVVAGSGSTLEVLNAANGNRLASYSISGALSINGAPSIADGRIVFGAGDSGASGASYALGIPFNASAAALPPNAGTPGTFSFRANGSGGAPTYNFTWTFGDGGNGSGPAPTHAFPSVGIYPVQMTALDSSGAVAIRNFNVTVSTPPPPFTARASGVPLAGVAPLNVTLSGSETNGTLPPFAFNWSFSDGTPNAGGTRLSHVFVRPGIYAVRLAVTEGGGRTSNATVSVRVVDPMTVQWTASPLSGLAPLQVAMASLPARGLPPYRFLWDFGDGSPASRNSNPVHYYNTTGTVTLTGHAWDALNESVVHTFSVTVNATVSPPPQLVASATITLVSVVCGAGPALYDLNGSATGGTPPYQFNWTFGDGSGVTSGDLVSHGFAHSGQYGIQVTVADAGGQQSYNNTTLQVVIPICHHPPPVQGTNSSGSFWTVWWVLPSIIGVAGAVALVVGWVWFRRRGAAPPS